MRASLWCWGVIVGLAACSPNVASKDAGPPFVLEVGSRGFTALEIDSLIQEQPEVLRGHYRSESGRAAFLERLMRSELLVQEARRQGLDRDPAVRAMVDRLLVQKLAEQAELPAVSEEQLRAAYQASLNEFVRPDRLHLRAIFWASVRGAGDRAAVQKQARGVAAMLSAVKPAGRETAFEAAARAGTSHVASKETGGDLGPRTAEELGVLFGTGLETGASALQQPGQVSELLETERGFVVLYLRGRQPGLTQTFESVRPKLALRLAAEGRTRALETLVERLKRDTRVQVRDGG